MKCAHMQHEMCEQGVCAVCCSVLQCVAVCCSVVQCVAVCCSVLQCVAVCCSVLRCLWDVKGMCWEVPICNMRRVGRQHEVCILCTVYRCVAMCCSVLQCVAVCCSVLQCVAMSMGCEGDVLRGAHMQHATCGKAAWSLSTIYSIQVCCSVLQCVAVCCSVLQCVAVCCSVWWYEIKHIKCPFCAQRRHESWRMHNACIRASRVIIYV